MHKEILHRLRNLLLRSLLRIIRLFSSRIDALLTRLRTSPGLPVLNPTESYWQHPRAPISSWGKDEELPEYADVVIIGSGITGTAFARTLLDWERDEGGGNKTSVVMLEARETCSGATGRNGGHITPILYAQYPSLLSTYGPHLASQIIRFRLSHLPILLDVAKQENLLTSTQARQVDAYDVFLNDGLWNEARQKLRVYERELGEEGWQVLEGDEAVNELGLHEGTKGCLGTKAGAIHPYRLVTGILQRLLTEFSSTFRLFTHTPCTSIASSADVYTLTTPRGSIQTRHIIHATNGWISHLLPGMRGKIVPARGVMTAQTLPSPTATPNPSWDGQRAFVFFPGEGWHEYDYLTQQAVSPPSSSSSSYPPPSGELMLGGGFASSPRALNDIGNANDAAWNTDTGDYLSGALSRYFPDFTRNSSNKEKDTPKSRVKSLWSGVLGVSSDGHPWVGRVPNSISGRPSPLPLSNPRPSDEKAESPSTRTHSDTESTHTLAPPGEWISAGYSGEGMVHAWLSGKALAYMVLGLDPSPPPPPLSEQAPSVDSEATATNLHNWFPSVYRVTEKRCATVGIEDLLAEFF